MYAIRSYYEVHHHLAVADTQVELRQKVIRVELHRLFIRFHRGAAVAQFTRPKA